ncbi:isocitrate lyase/phosphoenolpyruvate mutase family protein [Actinotalea ferrariae]|uniref:isocitrate lyase/PEP mutase family protein n=1 Tax=Actinotalea ferrariae TaxID=1386098 RepID=UPI001C8C54A6|nr:isocitrate lyase/phosphoenolpyruvate mutase family protein [Actinotalea ferrariae]MBX9245939.1 isocitrate lyase/phosphoenolpyruvate mutase family protein [Actinotalea ferrariae]
MITPAPADQRQVERAERLRSLHRPGDPLVLVNVWDAASARVVADAGATAIATASWGVSAAAGVPDGEGLSRSEALAAASRVVRAVDLPVTVDLEAGYGSTPDDVAETVELLVGTGAVGCNLEDSVPAVADHPHAGGLRPAAEQAERIAAARRGADGAGVPVVVNARCDALLHGGTPDDVLERGALWLASGADCVFVLGTEDLTLLRRFAEAFDGRLSVLQRPGSPALADLAAVGVCRVSVGPGAMGAAYAALAEAAAGLLAGGACPPAMAYRPPV